MRSARVASVRSQQALGCAAPTLVHYLNSEHQGGAAAAQEKRTSHYKSTLTGIFGLLGVPLLLVICVSIAWTTWLIVLNIDPNTTANYLMGTADFDDGAFWLIIDPDPAFLVLTCCGLGAVLLGYLYACAKMTFLRVCCHRVKPLGENQSFVTRSAHKILGDSVVTSWSTLTGFNGANRKLWNLWLKLVDIVLQLVTLHQVFEAGFPVSLCYAYSALVAANCFSYAVVILNHERLSAFSEVLVDTVFDMLITVGAPICLLMYSYYNFYFDRKAFRIVLELTDLSAFEQHARMNADPVQVTLFLINFNALRITTVLNFCMRIGMNLSFAYRLARVIEVVGQQAKQLSHKQRVHTPDPSLSDQHGVQKPVPKWMALVFFLMSCSVLAYTHACVRSSTVACSSYPQCVAFAMRAVASKGECPCVALVDVDKAPKTYSEWTNPPDATETVKALAASGDLKVLQVINRKLLQWPDELHNCRNLRYISLIHCQTNAIPAWAIDFEKLEFLHIEGKPESTNLVSLPDDLFAKMTTLTYLHLGMHLHLTYLPSFDGLSNLKSMTLAVITSLRDLPSLQPLQKVESLQLLFLTILQTAPDVETLPKLSNLLASSSQVCCNGVLGRCDTANSLCSSGVTCVTGDSGHQQKLEGIVEHFSQTVCSWDIPDLRVVTDSPPKELVDVCGGVMYRQCTLPGEADTMCYSNRMQVIACNPAVNNNTAIRRKQIQRGVGTPCDPVEEQWLGCTKP